MEFNSQDPYQVELFEAIKTVYDRHDQTLPLNHVNVVEWVEAIYPVVGKIVAEELTDALHPEFGWYHRED